MSYSKIFFDLHGARRTGVPVRFNKHTTWFDVVMGANDHHYIKRHNRKHNVVQYIPHTTEEYKIPDEIFHTTLRHVLSVN